MKRVNTLYRVSTKKQLNRVKDDIPMQRIACRAFIEKNPDWVLNKEYEEKGVSGYKVSAEKRDAIQNLKDAAVRGEFDVLLVFMFDRLGRIDNETPFILEWFTRQGIEVWSVYEGEQKFDSHVDKLTNYIRFWHAAGESQKISIRVKARMEQMTQEGIYAGGMLPFGYRFVRKGRLNKKGLEMRDLEVNFDEAEMILAGADKIIMEGYGTHQVARYFTQMGFRTRKGSEFQSASVKRLYSNPLLGGYMKRGNARSERIEHLQILSDDVYSRIQEMFSERAKRTDDKRRVALSNQSKALLSGNVFCMHCGSRMCTTSSRERYVRKDGSVYQRNTVRYLCYHRSRRLNECDGQATYRAERIDRYVAEIIKLVLSSMIGAPEEEMRRVAYQKKLERIVQSQKKLSEQMKKDQKNFDYLLSEIAGTISGTSSYSSDDLRQALQSVKKRIHEFEPKFEEMKREEQQLRELGETLWTRDVTTTWADAFEKISFARKKMIASEMFYRVEIGSGYRIHLELDMSYEEFCKEWRNKKMSVK